ncbi:MAG: tetratricopeptide repeat protein [Candidatus Rokubacteria bacterium]|nr:tetratricopeptide repeat protein [Candidatus Rokubacteria bacterium]
MRHAIRTFAVGLVVLAVAGCATAQSDGRQALRQGRYTDAATHFEEALAKDPDRLESLIGLGIARYKTGEYDAAIEPLGRAVSREPTMTTARLYLGLSYLRKSEFGPMEEHLAAVMAQRPGSRLAGQTDRAFRLLRGSDPLGDEMRAFIATSLEDELEAERQVAEAQRVAREAERRWRDAYYGYGAPILLRSRCRC